MPHQTTAPAGQRSQVLGAQTGTQREQKPKQTCNRTVAAVCGKFQHRKDLAQPTNLSARGYTPAAATKTAPCMCGACTLHTMAPHAAWHLNLQRAQARAGCAHVQRALHKHRQERCIQGGACAHPRAVSPLTSQHRKGIRMSAAVPITAKPMWCSIVGSGRWQPDKPHTAVVNEHTAVYAHMTQKQAECAADEPQRERSSKRGKAQQ